MEATLTGSWSFEPESAIASFCVREFGLVPVHGHIPVVSATARIDDGDVVQASATLDAAGVVTGNAKRDRDLRKPRFLSSNEHPGITWRAREARQLSDGTYAVDATLEVRGITTPLATTVSVVPRDDGTIAATLTAVLDRLAVGIRAPRVLVARQVEITVHVVMTRTVISELAAAPGSAALGGAS
ncbi:MAG: YceI family protein [Candidatus Nanopelagicales bacterium]